MSEHLRAQWRVVIRRKTARSINKQVTDKTGETLLLKAYLLDDEDEGQVFAETMDGHEVGGMRFGLGLRESHSPPKVIDLSVDERYQRRGIATLMFEYARSFDSTLQHSDVLTEQGRAFMRSTGARLARDVYLAENQVRPNIDALTKGACERLGRRILKDVGFPQADDLYVIDHPEGNTTSAIAWDRGTQPAIPLLALGRDMYDELTVIHECAHFIRNGPQMAGRQSGTDVDSVHDDQWFETYYGLIQRYATKKCLSLFQDAFTVGPAAEVAG